MTKKVYQAIEATIGRQPAETGGILGGSREDGVVTHFYFDRSARRSKETYSPDHNALNSLLRDHWNPAGIHMLGFVHNHPLYLKRPSAGDLDYACRILRHNRELERLLLPIVMSKPDAGHFKIFVYAVVRDGENARLERMSLELVPDKKEMASNEAMTGSAARQPMRVVRQKSVAAEGNSPRAGSNRPVTLDWSDLSSGFSLEETFRRVKDAYDLRRLAVSRLIAVGVGGGSQFLEDMARAGVGEFLLIDPDVVGETNLATQQTYRRDLGRPKVECLKDRLLDINPQALVVARQQPLEAISDAEFEQLAAAAWRQWDSKVARLWGLDGVDLPAQIVVKPAMSILCGLTDNFAAQTRVNRLALQFGLPSVCAQVYREGRGAEITLTYPGVTPACHRCALRSRYQAFLENGYKNSVTSDGTPIVATARLNSLKGFVTLAMLHHGTNHPRFGGLLHRIGNRSLIQIRMDPDVPLPVFERVFGGGDQSRILFDDVVWLPQQADCPTNGFPTCPDCGGTGDLRTAKGTFHDTKELRR